MGRGRTMADTSTYAGRVADRLHELRVKSGFSAEEIVERVNRFGYELTKHTYYGWERGRTQINFNALVPLKKALRIKTVGDMFPKQ